MFLFYLLISVMPMMRHPTWSELVGEFTVVKYVGGGAFVYALLYSLGRSTRAPFLDTRQAYWFLFFVAWTSVSYLVRGEAPFALSPLMSCLSFLQLFFITLVVVDSAQRLRAVLLTVVGSVGFASLHVLREWQNAGFATGYRPGWVTGDPNYYTLSALMGAPIAFYQMRRAQPSWERWFCRACLVLCLLGITAAASRGGFLGLIAGLALMVWRGEKRGRLGTVAVAILVPLMLFSPSSPVDRLLSPTHSDTEAVDSRMAHWRAAVRMVSANPFTGVGAGNFQVVVPQFGGPDEALEYIAHNSYLQVAAEMGLPGLVALVGLVVGTFRTTARVRRATAHSEPSVVSEAAAGIEVGLLSFCVATMFVSAEYQKLFWLFVFLSICLPRLQQESVQRVTVPDWPPRTAGLVV